MVALASTILFGLIAISLGLAQVPSDSFPGLLVFLAMLQVIAAGLLIWSIGLLSRHDHEAYIASLACFFGLMATRSTSTWPATGPYTALAQFTLGVMLGIAQIRILQSVVSRVQDTLAKGAA
ncbi:hypothetical protein [Fuscibacter oryzae]|uniref:Uncharacterized protein n=1 Tax=Fuscibacter oryzae TaxID=2803939 RepID=A0A8J7MVF3_9RHOB|nr:hypothetical protein [Fuscibacter oryzae]MBL4929800.1 hypothetical protein [Fuscibacter oryzae]